VNALALDLGLRAFGYAFNVESRVWAGAVELGRAFGGKLGAGALRGQRPAMRYVYFSNWLNGLPAAMDLDLVLYETPFQQHWTARKAMISLESRVHEFCARRNLPVPRDVNVKRLKSWTTAYPGGPTTKAGKPGYGNATKAQMMAAVKERWGHVAASDDEADAFALLQYGLENCG